jgi:hypothetical protein
VHDRAHVREVQVDEAGTVMRSVMPCTPFLRMSSAILKASIMLVRFSATCRSLSLGMMIRESTFSLRRLMPSSA